VTEVSALVLEVIAVFQRQIEAVVVVGDA